MNVQEELDHLRSGETFQGDIRPFVAPTSEALSELGAELRQNPSAAMREQVVKILVNLAVETDPFHCLRHRRILSILLHDTPVAIDEAYRLALDRIALLASPSVLVEFGTTLGKLVSQAPLPELFLVVAKAKAVEALPAMQVLEKDPRWAQDAHFRIAQAALGDQSEEDFFTKRFLATTDPREKMDFAIPVSQIGTASALKVLAEEMRSPLVLRIPQAFEMSVRIEIARAIHFDFPEQPFLLQIRSDEDYERIELFCQLQFGAQWTRPRPAFLASKSFQT